MTAVELVNSAWNAGMTPPPMTLVSQWADENRILPESSPEPGPYRTARTPYLREIMDCLSPSSLVREIDLIKGTQLGATDGPAFNWIGFIVDQSPANILCVLPDQATAKEWSQQRLSNLIDSTPCLQGKIKEARARDSGNTTFTKKFGGSYLKMAWASSAKKMRSMPAAYIVADEVDGFARDSDGEGSPIALLRKRFSNFPDGKFLRISTPTDKATSLIERGFQEGDQRYYFVPCPHCQHYQVIFFANLKHEKGSYLGVKLECIACREGITERFKTNLLQRGRWIATSHDQSLLKTGVPENELPRLNHVFNQMRAAKHASFHLSALYSPLGWYSWSNVVEDWDKAQTNTKELKTFVNTVLGETWVDKGTAPEWELLYERSGPPCEEGLAPYGVLFVTAGVDVQKDRVEVEIVGWGRNFHTWSISYHVIQGDPNQKEIWDKLEKFLKRSVKHEAGIEIPIWAIAIDIGYNSQEVYRFSKRFHRASHGHGRSYLVNPFTLVPTRGGYSNVKILESISNENAARTRKGLKIVTIGTHAAKQELYDWLRGRPTTDVDSKETTLPTGYAFFPRYEPSYFQGLCSESRVIRENGKVEWVKDPSIRNEPMDCRIMARAMASLFGIDRFREPQWLELESRLKRKEESNPDPVMTSNDIGVIQATPAAAATSTVQTSTVIRSNWMGRLKG